MRELKFRAWVQPDSFNQKPTMFTGFGFADIYSGYDEANVYCKDGQIWAEPDWETAKLMQYTGLKDKNGKEIYEGDILSFKANYTNKTAGRLNAVVEITPYKLELVIGNDRYNAYEETDEFPYTAEVIGNIYENQELLSNVNKDTN